MYDWWKVVPIDSPVVFLNLNQFQPGEPAPDRYRVLIGDGRQMAFPGREFDIAYSNSVIEHLRTWEDQQRFAAEMRRVGRGYFVQTPNRWFPIEPHFVTLFIHFLPRALCRKLIRPLPYRGWVRSGDNIDLRQLADELRLLERFKQRRGRTRKRMYITHRSKSGLVGTLAPPKRAPAAAVFPEPL